MDAEKVANAIVKAIVSLIDAETRWHHGMSSDDLLNIRETVTIQLTRSLEFHLNDTT